MNELSFSEKVKGAYDAGWNSNPDYGRAIREIKSFVKVDRPKTISVEELFVGDSEIDKNFFKRDDDER